MMYRVKAPIDQNTPTECLPHIGALVEAVQVHAVGCRCAFVYEVDERIVDDVNPASR